MLQCLYIPRHMSLSKINIMAWPGLPGTKKSRWQQSSSPKMAASVDDCVVQGTKAKWRISLLLPVMWWRERIKLKIEQHSNQTSAVTKLPLPPNSKQQGTRTKAKETWSPKPVKRYQDICSIPPNRASPSCASSEPAVSISLSLFGPLDPVGVALQF